ncbi:MAG: T9SS type A sorting domain-containing protein, partial [Sphingobacteriales bacterium]
STPAMGADEIQVTVAGISISAAGSAILCGDDDSTVLSVSPAMTVQWYRNGTLIPGATGAALTVDSEGYYRAVSQGGCYSDSSNYIFVSKTVIDTAVTINGVSLAAVSPGQYQWLDCDNGFASIPGANGQTFTPVLSGNYAALIAFNGCIDTTSCINVTISSIADVRFPGAHLYPNPGGTEVYLSVTSPLANATLTITNSLGQQVRRLEGVNGTLTRLPAADLLDGIYCIIVSEKGVSKTFKWVKAIQ